MQWWGMVQNCSKTEEFVKQHDTPDPISKKIHWNKRFIDEINELVVDRPIVELNQRLKIELYFKNPDWIEIQLEDRFCNHSMEM